jgi:hypothetical protein
VSKTKIKLSCSLKEKLKLELHCKLRGRCGSERAKRFLGSRLTQGTILLIREGKGVPLWKRRTVIALFRAGGIDSSIINENLRMANIS